MTVEVLCNREQIQIARYPYYFPVPNDSGTYQAALARIMWALNVGTQEAMTDAIGVSQESADDAERRNSIPAQWLVRLQLQWNISPLWVLTGYIPPVRPGLLNAEEIEQLMKIVH